MNLKYIDDGGSAFPRPIGHNGLEHFEEHESNSEQEGMSLRDYFAAKALNGFLSDAQSMVALRERYGHEVALNLAEACYQFADAMIEARKP